MALLEQVASDLDAEAFLEPVNLQVELEYAEKIKEPMDISTIRKRLQSNAHKHQIMNLTEFERLLNLMFNNAKAFNPPRHAIYKSTVRLQQKVQGLLQAFGDEDKSDTQEQVRKEARRAGVDPHGAFLVVGASQTS